MNVSPATRLYETQLRKVAKAVGETITSIYQGGVGTGAAISDVLTAYSEALVPWATRTAERMLGDIQDRSRQSFRALGNEISLGLRRELERAPTGERFSQLLAEQVGLIQSIPLEAAQRVHKLTTEALVAGRRMGEVAQEIARSEDVSTSRAILIARTEASRAATTFVQARAEYVGSTHFIWRTSRDGAVRPTHKRLEAKVFRWEDPPECDPGYHALPGAIFNCRCYPEPILPDLH